LTATRGQGKRTIAITSGKGGVGKTSLAVAIGSLLARSGRRVILVDLDLGLANVDVLLGFRPKFHLQHLLAGARTLDEVAFTAPSGLRVIPSSSGVEELANLDEAGRGRLLRLFQEFERQADILLLDTAPGIAENVVRFVAAADTAVVITTPEATSMTDAYALIKVVSARRQDIDIGLLVNMARSSASGRQAQERIGGVARRFLGATPRSLGVLPFDDAVGYAAAERATFVHSRPNSPASLCLGRAVAELMEGSPAQAAVGPAACAARLAALAPVQEVA